MTVNDPPCLQNGKEITSYKSSLHVQVSRDQHEW